MVGSKIKKASVTTAKKNIVASFVRVANDMLVDDEGSIASRIIEQLPEGTTTFDIKISIELPENGKACEAHEYDDDEYEEV